MILATILKTFIGKSIKNDILSGVVVAVALIPEAIAFSIMANVSPLVGLYTAFILGAITALIGGKAGMISGATGAVAVVIISLGISVKNSLPDDLSNTLIANGELSAYILQYILLATILAGVIQMLIGALKMGKLIRLVPEPAMLGFVNGLAIIIALSQLPLFKGEGVEIYIIVVATMAILYLFPKLPKIGDKLPAGLVAIVTISLVVIGFDIDTKKVGDLADISGNLPSFNIPHLDINLDVFLTILPYSILIALVGLIESLLTLSVLDEMDGKRGSGNQECIAQGVGNVTCGFFGGMAGCVMIGQSIINFTNGGFGRLSSLTAALLLITFVVGVPSYIALIPVGVLVGIMFMVSIGTFAWESANKIRYMPNTDKVVLVSVSLITIFADLAIAVIVGIIISALAFAWEHSKIRATTRVEDGIKIYDFDGILFFGSITNFFNLLDAKNDPKYVVLDFKNVRVVDISAASAIDKITKKYKTQNKNIGIRHLSKDCRAVLKNAGPFCEFNDDDPSYKLALD